MNDSCCAALYNVKLVYISRKFFSVSMEITPPPHNIPGTNLLKCIISNHAFSPIPE